MRGTNDGRSKTTQENLEATVADLRTALQTANDRLTAVVNQRNHHSNDAVQLATGLMAAQRQIANLKTHLAARTSSTRALAHPPPDVKAAWTLIKAKVAETAKLLAKKNVEPIHEIGEQLEAAVRVLTEKSTMVTGDKKNRLASALKQCDA